MGCYRPLHELPGKQRQTAAQHEQKAGKSFCSAPATNELLVVLIHLWYGLLKIDIVLRNDLCSLRLQCLYVAHQPIWGVSLPMSPPLLSFSGLSVLPLCVRPLSHFFVFRLISDYNLIGEDNNIFPFMNSGVCRKMLCWARATTNDITLAAQSTQHTHPRLG